jgi:hypothetical protein
MLPILEARFVCSKLGWRERCAGKKGHTADQLLGLSAQYELNAPTATNITAIDPVNKFAPRNRSKRPITIKPNNPSPIKVMAVLDIFTSFLACQ